MSANILQDRYGAAIIATIAGTSARWTMLDSSDGNLRAEYGRIARLYQDGSLSRVLVRPLPVTPVEGQDSEGAGASRIPFVLEFTLVDKVLQNALSDVMQAMRSTFGDRGAQLAANLTDPGSNLIGSPGEVTIEAAEEQPAEFGIDHARVDVLLVVEVRHKIPMS